MKKLTKLFTIILATMMVFVGCKSGEALTPDEPSDSQITDTSSTTDKPNIRIGMMSSYDVIPYVMINELGLDEKYNFELDLEVFTSAKDRDAAFLAGELDGVLTDYIGVCIYQNANFDVKITGVTDGDYVLVAGKNSGINSLEEIEGRSIAISENTLIDYALDQILTKSSYESNALVKEIVPRIPDRLELLRNEQIDLGLLPEPFASIVLNECAIYLGSANDMGLYPAVSAFVKTSIEEKEEGIRNLYKAYNEVVEHLNKTDVASYEDIVIQTVGYPAEMAGQIEIEPFRTSTLPPQKDVEDAVKWASNKGLCKDTLTYDQLVYDVYSK